MLLIAVPLNEAPVEIGYEVRRPPIELGGDGRHKRRHETRKDDAPQRMWHVIVHQPHVRRLGMSKPRIQHNHREGSQNPRPGANSIVRDIEPQHREQTIALITRAEDPLGNIASASRLRAWIPKRPPL